MANNRSADRASAQFSHAANKAAVKAGANAPGVDINNETDSELAGGTATQVEIEKGTEEVADAAAEAAAEALHETAEAAREEGREEVRAEFREPRKPSLLGRAARRARSDVRIARRLASNIWHSNARVKEACRKAGLRPYGFGPFIIAVPDYH